MMGISCQRFSAGREYQDTRSSALREEPFDEHKAIRRQTYALRKLAIVLCHFPGKGHTGRGRTLPAVDLWQEFVDLSSIHSHDLIVAEEHAAADTWTIAGDCSSAMICMSWAGVPEPCLQMRPQSPTLPQKGMCPCYYFIPTG